MKIKKNARSGKAKKSLANFSVYPVSAADASVIPASSRQYLHCKPDAQAFCMAIPSNPFDLDNAITVAFIGVGKAGIAELNEVRGVNLPTDRADVIVNLRGPEGQPSTYLGYTYEQFEETMFRLDLEEGIMDPYFCFMWWTTVSANR